MDDLELKGAEAKRAAAHLALLRPEEKNAVLLCLAAELAAQSDSILTANRWDLERFESGGGGRTMLDRLRLDERRIGEMINGIHTVLALPDPVGEEMESWQRPNGLQVRKIRVPMGVIGIIYEARPNVTVDASALCLKTGNAVLLQKPGTG